MKERIVTLNESILKGLRMGGKSGIYYPDRPGLLSLSNLRIKNNRIEGLTFYNDLIVNNEYIFNSITKDWPYPQAFFANQMNDSCIGYLLTASKLYKIDSNYELTEVSMYNYLSNSNTDVPTADAEKWQYVSHDGSIFFTNTKDIVFKRYELSLQGLAEKVFILTSKGCNALCYHKGRYLFGGFNSSILTNNQRTQFSSYFSQEGITLNFDSPNDKQCVWWSQLGGANVLHPFVYQEIENNYLGKSFILTENDYLKPYLRMDSGFAYCESDVYGLESLDNNVLILCAEQLYVLRYVTQPFRTYGKFILDAPGMLNLNCSCKIKDNILYIGTDYNLYLVSRDLKIQKLEYNEYISQLDKNDIIMTYDNIEEECFISDGSISYVLGRNGLSQYQRGIISGHTVNGVYKTIHVNLGTLGLQDDSIEFKTEALSFGTQTIKRLTNVYINGDFGNNLSNLKVSIGYRYNLTSDYSFTEWRRVNDIGQAAMYVAGVDFIIKVKLDDLGLTTEMSDSSIVGMSVGVSYEDRTGILGYRN